VVGGGAAGVFAAIACAEANRGARLLVIEKGSELLAKVRISGGGRCNVTHACFDAAELVRKYPRGGRELRGPFHSWQPEDTIAWFHQRGVELKTEDDGRVFPVTDSSATIVDCLVGCAQQAGVQFRTRTGFVDAGKVDPGRFKVDLSQGEPVWCGNLLVAAGGLKPGPLVQFLEKMGHNIEPLAPSLFTFHVQDDRIAGLQGVAVTGAAVSIPGTDFAETGPVLVTHWGLSGPGILKVSAWGARWAKQQNYRFPCVVNWVHPRNAGETGRELARLRAELTRRLVRKTPCFELPLRLWERLVQAAEIGPEVQWNQLRREQAHRLMEQLTESAFQVIGKSMFKEEFVTCGGVRLKEVNFKTMESRLVPGLYFAGEVLDIDAVTGGFNFQSAWTTGMLAGRALGRRA